MLVSSFMIRGQFLQRLFLGGAVAGQLSCTYIALGAAEIGQQSYRRRRIVGSRPLCPGRRRRRISQNTERATVRSLSDGNPLM